MQEEKVNDVLRDALKMLEEEPLVDLVGPVVPMSKEGVVYTIPFVMAGQAYSLTVVA